MKHVKKYADLYVDRNCAVVYGIAPLPSLLFGHVPTFNNLAMEGVREVCNIVRTVEKEKKDDGVVPILTHVFSNGGALVTFALDSLLEETIKAGKKETQDEIDLLFFAERIQQNGFEIFDSAPAYLYPELYHSVIETAIPNVPMQMVAKALIWIGKSLHELSDAIASREPFPTRFWKDMIESEMFKRQAFLYSTTDKLTDYSKVEELIEIRKSRGIDILAFNFKDSDHVQHWRKYPKEYEHMLEKILEKTSS